MTKRQLDALKFIKAYMAEHEGVAPSFDEMRLGLGYVSKSHVHRLMGSLEEQGFIRRLPYRARAIEVVESPSMLALANIPDQALMMEVDRRWPGTSTLVNLVALTA